MRKTGPVFGLMDSSDDPTASFFGIRHPKADGPDFARFVRELAIASHAAVAPFFASRFSSWGFRLSGLSEELGSALSLLRPHGGPHIAWLLEGSQRAVAIQALFWSARSATWDPHWVDLPSSVVAYLMALCGVEMAHESDHRESQLRILRRYLAGRPDGGPLLALAVTASPPRSRAALVLGPLDEPMPCVAVVRALELPSCQHAATSFMARCRHLDIHVPTDPQMLISYVRRLIPDQVRDTQTFPSAALPAIASALAWAHRAMLAEDEWAQLPLPQKDFLLLCGGMCMPRSASHRDELLAALRFRLAVADIVHSRWPPPSEADLGPTSMSILTMCHFGKADDLFIGGPPPPGEAFRWLCRVRGLAIPSEVGIREGLMRDHWIRWGKGPAAFPMWEEDEFLAAALWGAATATTASAEQDWQALPTTLGKQLLSVFGWNAAQPSWSDALALTTMHRIVCLSHSPRMDDRVPFLSRGMPPLITLESCPATSNPRPSAYFLNVLLVGQIRWLHNDEHAREVLVAAEMDHPRDEDSASRQWRLEVAAAVVWCWIHRSIPALAPGSLWALAPRDALVFSLQILTYLGTAGDGHAGAADGPPVRGIIEAVARGARGLWALRPRLSALLSACVPLPATPVLELDRWECPDPLQRQLGDWQSFFVPACAFAGLRFPHGSTACLEALMNFTGSGPSHFSADATSSPARTRELTAALTWATASVRIVPGFDYSPPTRLPPEAHVVLSSLIPGAASGWEWRVGRGIHFFWARFIARLAEMPRVIPWSAEWVSVPPDYVQGDVPHLPGQAPLLHRQTPTPASSSGRSGEPSRPLRGSRSGGHKRPRVQMALLPCEDPGPLDLAGGPSPLDPPASAAAHHARILLASVEAFRSERNAAIAALTAVTAQSRAAAAEVTLLQAGAVKAEAAKNLLREESEALRAELAAYQVAADPRVAGGTSDSSLQGEMAVQVRITAEQRRTIESLNDEIRDLRATTATLSRALVAAEAKIESLQAAQERAARQTEELSSAAVALTQEDQASALSDLQAENQLLRGRVEELELAAGLPSTFSPTSSRAGSLPASPPPGSPPHSSSPRCSVSPPRSALGIASVPEQGMGGGDGVAVASQAALLLPAPRRPLAFPQIPPPGSGGPGS